MKNLRTLIAVPALALSSGLLADPSTSPKPGEDPAFLERAAAARIIEPFFNELDCEGLDYVQSGEVAEHMSGVFFSFDSDRSRSVSRQEWLRFPHIRSQSLKAFAFDIADSDDSGEIDYLELTRYMERAIRSLDGNGDDEVYRSDLEQYFGEARRSP